MAWVAAGMLLDWVAAATMACASAWAAEVPAHVQQHWLQMAGSLAGTWSAAAALKQLCF
jgi:hypothetical protein